jgi:hypothetical protein
VIRLARFTADYHESNLKQYFKTIIKKIDKTVLETVLILGTHCTFKSPSSKENDSAAPPKMQFPHNAAPSKYTLKIH